MAFTVKVLADGQLPAAKGTLYTVPALTKAYIRFLTMHNASGSNGEQVQVFVNASGTSRRIAQATLDAGEFARVLDDGETLELEAGDLLEGLTSNAARVDYTVTGVEET